MRKVCAWCKTDLGETPSEDALQEAVTHGICESCASRILAQPRESLHEFLDRLGVPILLIDADTRILTANCRAQTLLNKALPAIENRRPGDAIECVHAKTPEGCGRTSHCKACTIRRTVLETWTTGKSRTRVPAVQDIAAAPDTRQVRFLISTEKVGSYVMLRIDEKTDPRV